MGALGAALFALDRILAEPDPGRRDGAGGRRRRRRRMRITAGIDVGSTYTKAVVLDAERRILGRALEPTGFKLDEVAESVLAQRARRGRSRPRRGRVRRRRPASAATRWPSADTQVTDLTAERARRHVPLPRHPHRPRRRRPDDEGEPPRSTAAVKSFRLNDKCAAGTGAFLEKTARYMGYSTDRDRAAGRHLEERRADLRRLRRLRRVGGDQPALRGHAAGRHHARRDRLAGRPLGAAHEARPDGARVHAASAASCASRRWSTVVREQLGQPVNVPEGDLVQFTSALGAALLGQLRLQRLAEAAAATRAPGPRSRPGAAEPERGDRAARQPPDDEPPSSAWCSRRSIASSRRGARRRSRPLADGWERRFVADGPRADEAVALYAVAGLRGRRRCRSPGSICRPTAPTASWRRCSRSRRSTPASPKETDR